jgi:glycine/D-amino acid oxidase-like deaminating enzyme
VKIAPEKMSAVDDFDAAVIGGGLVGTATAYELGRAGLRTVLIDRGDVGRATDAGAGILSPETAKRDDAAWLALVQAAGAHYDTLVPELGDDTGWARCGILQLATRDTDVPPWKWVAERATGGSEISPDEARAMVPVLGSVVRALYHPGAARVDGRLLCAALRRAALEHYGIEARSGSVHDIEVGASTRLAVDGADVRTQVVVIAGGAWTAELSSALGVKLPVGPLRGQIMHLDVDDHDTGAWPIVQPVYGHYMVPWDGGRVAIGATVEEAGFAPEVTAGGVYEILREGLRVLPGLASARVRDVRVGLRPASIDDLPILGPLPGTSNVLVATGHGANGLLLGPVSGVLIADVVVGRTPLVDLAPFAPARFLL